jgi:molybdate/tungstate transport system substrate-binding protein
MMRNLRNFSLRAAALLVLVSVLVSGGCHSSSPAKTRMTVLVADSLVLPFQEIEKSFELKYPGLDVLTEGHGSIQVIRTITEIGQAADVALVADDQLIPLLMYSTQRLDQAGPYADWYIDFATNSLGIAYQPHSLYAQEITPDNWYQIMSRPEVKIGLSDPLIDSLAYRALMCVQLAQSYYAEAGLFEKFFGGSFKLPLHVETTGEKTVIHVPESIQPAVERIKLRSYNLQILALLQSGDVDYAFEYESVARQQGLQFLKLPAAINLGSPELAQSYAKVGVKMDFQRFASVMPQFEGASIVYAATIPTNAPHPDQAVAYLAFVLSNEGQSILKNNFQPPLIPPEANHPERVPNNLVGLIK